VIFVTLGLKERRSGRRIYRDAGVAVIEISKGN
jgi:hypothetical protein